MQQSANRAGFRRRWVLFIPLAFIAPLLPGPPSLTSAPAQAQPQPRVSEAANTAAAVRAAQAQKSPVRVADLTTETKVVEAQPDGTATATLSVQPVRVKRANGWVKVDTTLVRREDGSIGPKAAAVDLTLSGGGATKALVQLGKDGGKLAHFWPGALPAPVLAGSVATYPEVFPGVDLRIRADVQGYVQHLVIKDAQAAKNPALARLRLRTSTVGLTVKTTKDGGIEAVNKAGKRVFVAPPLAMWDAAGATSSGSTAKTAKPDSAAKAEALVEPAPQARRAVAKVVVDKQSLTVVPDQALLTNPKTRFPVVVDPDWGAPETGWAKVFSGKPNTKVWRGGEDGDQAKVGQCWPSTACNGIGAVRTYFQYDTGFLAGRHVMWANLNSVVTYSPSCADRNHQLFIAVGTVGPDTTWNNAPQGAGLETKTAGSVYNGCAGNKAVGFSTWGNIRPGAWSTYFIKAVDEGDGFAWRKYNIYETSLLVNYNTRPNPAYELNTQPRLPTPCRWCGGEPFIGDERIQLEARLSDPDGDQLWSNWVIYGGPSQETGTRGPNGSGGLQTYDLDLQPRDGQRVSWGLWTSDGKDGGDGVNSPTAFRVDRTGVSTKPNVTGLLYPDDNRWHGGVTVPGDFTFDANGVADIDHYVYGFQDPPTTPVDADALGGKATVSLTPPGDGPRDLYVRSVDRAGHQSPNQVHHFYVRAGNGALTHYPFEGNAKDEAFLGDRDATLSGNVSFVPGAIGSAIRLDGQPTSFVTAPAAVHTNASFSVSAWVKPEPIPAGEVMGIATQEGNRVGSFYLNARQDNNKWTFMVTGTDTDGPTYQWAVSPAAPEPGKWTHLVGVYDRPASKIRLYVNGVRVAETPLPAGFVPFDAPGPLRIGRAKWNGGFGNSWKGAIDEVQLHDRVLSDAEIRTTVGRDNVQAGYWKFDEESGTTARNEVADSDMVVLSNGASFTGKTGGAVGGAVRLDGVDDYAATNGPVVRTDQSFTVSAWVTLDKLAEGNAARTILSQEGTKDSGFYLQQRGTSWVLGMTAADGGTPFGFDVLAASAAGTAQINTPTHITAVYDAVDKRGSLYVDGKLAASDLGTAPAWNATGPLVIGRAKAAGTNVDYVQGIVDEVRAYSRELSEAEISGIVARANVTLGTWKLDGNAEDANANKFPGELKGSPDWTGGQTSVPDPTDLAIRLNGNDAHVSAGHAIDVNKTFSVAAWAKLDKIGGLPTVVSQDADQISSFKLRATTDGRWSFIMFGADSVDASRDEVIGTAVQVGAWTHLVASYDAVGHQLSLYVNGVQAGTKAHLQPWNPILTGGLQIGRAKWSGAAQEYFPGAIDDVSAYSRLLFADEIRTMAGRDLALVHNWQLDEPSGTSAVDDIGIRGGTMSGGVTHVPGRLGNAVQLDSAAKGVVSTEHVDLRTDTSFTVSAWVNLPSKDCDLNVTERCRTDAVSIDGDKTSKFRLGHVIDDNQSPQGAWTFEMAETDTVGAQPTKAAVTTKPSDLNHWVHLVGVYDAPTKKLWLYVDGIRIGDGTQNNRWNAGGGLQIGRGKTDGNPVEYWNGGVDDVRLYTGALDKDRISALFHSYPSEEVGKPATMPVADAGYWKFDENTGTAVADSSGRGNTATLKGGTEWIGGRKGSAAWLDGSTGYAETAGSVLDTSKSFSATAWAYLTDGNTGNRVVIGQDGNRVSPFFLMYDGGLKKWAAAVTAADQDNPTSSLVYSTELAGVGVWTHLAVVYNAELKQLRLYVNGLLSGARTGVVIRPSTGPFTIGRVKWNGLHSAHFPRGIDDVRLFTKPLSDGEVRVIHDDVTSVNHGYWRFDNDTVKDTSWLNMPTTTAGGPTFGPGVAGRALQLDGVDDSAATSWGMLNLRDSISVSGWVKLSRDDKTGTVAGQDGVRMSGFVLQYRAGLKRWVFGAPTKDADGAPLVYASSTQTAELNRWTHLIGVYDHSARQLRLYVNGELAGTKKDVTLWPASDVFALGRGKVNGVPADFFPGAIDDVRPELGLPSAAEIATRANWAAPPAGQLGRFLNAAGDHYTGLTTASARSGYHFEASFGRPVAADQPNTLLLYGCKDGVDYFTSKDAGCDGKTPVSEIGRVFGQQPTNLATIPLYSCTFGSERSDSRVQDCEGSGAQGVLLGYTVAYSSLTRYVDTYDHWSTASVPPTGYRSEGLQGYLAMSAEAGTQQLVSCLDGADQFVSLDPACEGKKVLGGSGGQIWTAAPAGVPSKALYRCLIGTERYTSTSATCEGYPVDRLLGYVLTSVPAGTAVFGS